MYAIVTLLDDTHYSRIESIWQELEAECGLAGIRFTPLPHFSWHIAQGYDFPTLLKVLEKITAIAKPFSARTAGLGLFSGAAPVLYFPVVRDPLLTEFHRILWRSVAGLGESPNPHYAPEVWMPHITLAHGDVNRRTICCAVEKLVFQSFNWEITVDNLALVNQHDSQVGELQYRLPFSG